MPDLQVEKIRVIFFDLFGTCFDASSAGKEAIESYAEQIDPWRKCEIGSPPTCEPLELPVTWSTLPAFPDAQAALSLIRNRYTCITLSNLPLWMQIRMCKLGLLHFDGMIPMEVMEAYKPYRLVYFDACLFMKTTPDQCLMVTSNKDFGDLEGAAEAGMQTILVDRYEKGDGTDPRKLTDLAGMLGVL